MALQMTCCLSCVGVVPLSEEAVQLWSAAGASMACFIERTLDVLLLFLSCLAGGLCLAWCYETFDDLNFDEVGISRMRLDAVCEILGAG